MKTDNLKNLEKSYEKVHEKNWKETLYIAYGSNLNQSQMKRRCPTAKIVGTAVLRDWRLIFRDTATIERCADYTVPILVWKLSPDDECALDRYEGWPRLYRKEVLEINLDGGKRNAMAYVMNERNHPYGPPMRSYVEEIRQGYKEAGFDQGILYQAVGESVAAAIKVSPVIPDKETADDAGVERIDEVIKQQILSVRDTGEANMLDTPMVRRIASREGFYELAAYLEKHRKEYARFILTGDDE